MGGAGRTTRPCGNTTIETRTRTSATRTTRALAAGTTVPSTSSCGEMTERGRPTTTTKKGRTAEGWERCTSTESGGEADLRSEDDDAAVADTYYHRHCQLLCKNHVFIVSIKSKCVDP